MRRHTIDITYTPHTLLLKRQWCFRDLMWKTVPHCITIKKESIKEIILGCYTWNSCVSLPFPLTVFSRLSHELRSDKPELWTREIAKIFKSAKYCPCTYEHRTSTAHITEERITMYWITHLAFPYTTIQTSSKLTVYFNCIVKSIKVCSFMFIKSNLLMRDHW